MIHEKDLDESIARYQGETEPTIETCQKLAACLYVKHMLFESAEQPEQRAENAYSFAAEPVEPVDTRISYYSETAFSQAISGRRAENVWPIIDELFSTLRMISPRLHDDYIRRLQR